ncbi:MAG: OsmC family protein [Balneolaceae bacterium]
MSENEKKIVHVHLSAEDYKTVLTAGPHEIIADEPERSGGKNLGPDPYDLLLMSLGTCSVVTLRMYAERKGWPLEDIYVELRHFRDHASDCDDCSDPGKKIDKIEKEFIFRGELTEEQKTRLLEIADKCPVNRTLKGEVEVRSELGD